MEASTSDLRRTGRVHRAAQASLIGVALTIAAMVTIGLTGELTRPGSALPELPPIGEPPAHSGPAETVDEVVTVTVSWADRERRARIIHQETIRNGSQHRHGRLDEHGLAIYRMETDEMARLRALANQNGDREARETDGEATTVRVRLQSPLVERKPVRDALWAAGTAVAFALTGAIITLSRLTRTTTAQAGRAEQ